VTKEITRAVGAAELSDLLSAPRRASLAFVRDGLIDASPVRFRYGNGAYLVVPPEGAGTGSEVALLIDEGLFHTELRGVMVRGTLEAPGDDGWAAVAQSKLHAWDYGAMRRRQG
jgi:hypothetical protein